ncbi:hypothetical protein CC86DRAFT_74276 [Ophiobolus disseminans]|uniref:Uncharacterized protein n=1 Tax=Ophiobolus disseminans TaxID=1469910 RepID=A0A6A6ZQA0_9PLEO|nr:hypothetical protein CC86DRAFT_74276 [Ophiobolus disseminans]
MKSPYRVARLLLILALSTLPFRALYGCFAMLWAEPHSQLGPEDVKGELSQTPSSQEIAASMNTLWDMWDEDHCKNICAASWTACRLRHCDNVPGVRRPDEL